MTKTNSEFFASNPSQDELWKEIGRLNNEVARLEMNNNWLESKREVCQSIVNQAKEVVIKNYLSKGQKIMAIKFIKGVFSCGLQDAKDIVESYQE